MARAVRRRAESAAIAAAATTAAQQLTGHDGARLYTREHGKALAEATFEIKYRAPPGRH